MRRSLATVSSAPTLVHVLRLTHRVGSSGSSPPLRGGLATGVLLLMAVSVGAQSVAPLTSNRPGIGNSEALVGRGMIQVEGGMQVEGAPQQSDQQWTQTWGQLTMRFGLTPRVEIFSTWDGLSVTRLQAGGASHILDGGNDLLVGTKLAVMTEARHHVTLTVEPAWSFPIGADAFSSNSNDGSFRVLWARSLPRDWSVSGNLLSTRTSDTAGRLWHNEAMLSLTRAATPTVSAFAELSGGPLGNRADVWTLDAGAAWVAGPDVQWDVSAGHTFNDRGNDWFVSAGVSLRRR
jgi:outer membrane putative beta-barrel porin/alpha-amylase